MPVWLAIMFAGIGACGTMLAAFHSLRKGQKEIHILVNNRLTEALSEIRRLGGREQDF